MKKKILIGVLGMLCLFFKVQAQDDPGYKGLKEGDKVPDLLILPIAHYPGGSARITDFGTKLLILDFWATTCGNCIEKFPEEIALQKRFKDSIRFLLVNSKNTRDTKERVSRFFAAHRAYTQLPSVTDDTVLFKLFPHFSEPHYVWIRNDTVLAISGGNDINEKTISSFLAGKSLTLHANRKIAYDFQKQLFINGNGGEPGTYLYRSILTPYKAGLSGAIYFSKDTQNRISGYRFVNLSRLTLYEEAYHEYNHFDNNRIIFRVKHPQDYATDSISESWKTRNVFIYEASFPPVSRNAAFQFMQQELDRFFHLRVDSEYRDVPCLIIKSRRYQKRLPLKPQQEAVTFSNETFLRDYPLSDLVSYFNGRSKIPAIDESGFKGTMRMNSELSDLSAGDVLVKLREKGFTITQEIRRLSFLVLSEKPASD